ncbi:MAG: type II toxin-antitoxin system RelE/ParE family toxin [Hyphomonas sp.]|uniref:type II toxin-antitoxin system RelE/ParE family toxin n=1 Tax=Hyphomonas sp. TaxID=87 RepID=UPI0018018B53|nr:type II toxin-antitoxin system RelE/ParE family toxin [Hyphomonas sp.]MBA3068775.1 type II toxin-antitoxin system RelE/ParE family toxin [Hyphomonas sp.]MBU3919234.1 type II toxin-antitoxin system RelE/ParE family toxin [Alphaproteobacteria bacterium]MBU4062708.1 type II toxin-antitoxin system RelE/ParE family toxin [Alphaproteobacteria bacterium]MBU4166216.1 type II toxin-antitoxin system RelE/ParE family toxin [Alphaproteobacteria bacterium]
MIPARLVFTRAARADLAVIAHHIQQNSGSSKSALRAVASIRAAADSLCEFPLQGKDRSDLVPGIRSWPAGKAIIFYSVGGERETVVIRAIFYGGQNYDAILAERRKPETE